MRIRCVRLLTAVVVVLVLSGCQDSSDKTAFVIVDGDAVTAETVKEAVLVEAKIREMGGAAVPEKDFRKWANQTAMDMVVPLMNAKLLEHEVKRLGVCPGTQDVARALAEYNARTRKKASTVDELAKSFGDLEDAFRRQFDHTARFAAYEREHWSIPPTDDWIRRYFIEQTNALQNAERIDAKARHNAEAAYRRLKAGEKWETVAKDCSEDKLQSPAQEKYSKEWIWTNEDGFGIKELAVLLPKMKVGDYTPPLESPAGLLIVRLAEKNERLYKLARILFRMAKPVSLPKDWEQARSIVQRRQQRSRQKETMSRLMKKAKVEYPMGMTFTYLIWKDDEK